MTFDEVIKMVPEGFKYILGRTMNNGETDAYIHFSSYKDDLRDIKSMAYAVGKSHEECLLLCLRKIHENAKQYGGMEAMIELRKDWPVADAP